jgi:hypothetical protein
MLTCLRAHRPPDTGDQVRGAGGTQLEKSWVSQTVPELSR